MNVRAVGNALVLWILRSPLHRLLSSAVAVVEYEGRRSGRRVRFPAQYATLDGLIVVWPARAESKVWWRNFEQPHDASVTIAGRRLDAVGEVVRCPDSADARVIAYRRRFPKAPAPGLIVAFTTTEPMATDTTCGSITATSPTHFGPLAK